MGGSVDPDALWVLPARPSAVRELRHRAVEFASAAGASDEVVEAVATAVSESVTNAVVHAYRESDGDVRLSCRRDGDRLIVEVLDSGAGIAPRPLSPGIGHGLAIIGAVAQTLDITRGPTGRGTLVTMTFGAARPPAPLPGLEMLCALAVETVADVSCLDLVGDGVLRRAAAQVGDDPELTAWLCAAVPPAKPGTATWAALREGEARLVVHDPGVPRSPGGPGERLDLAWWVAIPLDNADGTPAALWGLGGQASGVPVPSAEVIQTLADAGRADLTHAGQRALLRARLTAAGGRTGAGDLRPQ